MADEDCVTGILVDLSEPKMTPNKWVAKAQDLLIIKQRAGPVPIFDSDCATGILIDLGDVDDFQPPSVKKKKETPFKCTQWTDCSPQECLNQTDASAFDSLILDVSSLDGITLDLSRDSQSIAGNRHNCRQPVPLNACQMAEIFEQANTVAVRIELAGIRLATPDTKKCPSIETSAEHITAQCDSTDCLSPDKFPAEMFATSTPTKKAAPGVDIHFLGVESTNILSTDLEEKPKPKEPSVRVVRNESLKQPLTIGQKRNKEIGRTTSLHQPLKVPGNKVLSKRMLPTSHASDTKVSPASSTVSDGAVPVCAAKSRVSQLAKRNTASVPKMKTRVSALATGKTDRNPPPSGPPSGTKQLKPELHDKASVKPRAATVRNRRDPAKENVDDDVSKPASLPSATSGRTSSKCRLSLKTMLPRNNGVLKNQ